MQMKSQDTIGVVFVNTVVGRGVLNGVINLSFGTCNFTPADDGAVDPDVVVSSRLRMDQVCARQLHETLGELLRMIDDAAASGVTSEAPTEAAKIN